MRTLCIFQVFASLLFSRALIAHILSPYSFQLECNDLIT